MRLFWACLVVLLCLTANSRGANLGGNVEGMRDYASNHMFVDLMKQARGFGHVGNSDCYTSGNFVTVDTNGWPTQDACTTMLGGGNPVAGVYKLSFNGQATVGGCCGWTITNKIYDTSANITTADLNYLYTTYPIILNFTNTNGGIQNLRLLRPGYPYNTTDVFSHEFLNSLAPFPTLRAMDLMDTNGNPTLHWSDRTLPTTPSQVSAKGMSWEYIALMANTAGKDIWINIPIGADDDYVLRLAQLLKVKLNPGIHVYVEYSNEVWNYSFTQFAYNLNLATTAVANGDTTLSLGGTDTNIYYQAYRHVAERIIQISGIFRGVYGAAAMNDVIRPVLAGQFVGWYAFAVQMRYIRIYFGPPANFLYGIAGAPYFSPDKNLSQSAGLTLDTYLANLADKANDLADQYSFLYTLAQRNDLKYLSYEAGPDTTGTGNGANLPIALASAMDPRMQAILYKYYANWFGCAGGGLLNHFTLTGVGGKYGTWGLTDDPTNLTEPKYLAAVHAENTPQNAFLCQYQDPADSSSTVVALNPHPQNGTGLTAQYFQNATLSTGNAQFATLEPLLHLNFAPSVSPFGMISTFAFSGALNDFSARWTGQVIALASENYTFEPQMSQSDGARVWIGGQLIIDGWSNCLINRSPISATSCGGAGGTPGTLKWLSGSVALQAGKAYDVKIEYFHEAPYSSNNPRFSLYWSSASLPKSIVPTAQLLPATLTALTPSAPRRFGLR